MKYRITHITEYHYHESVSHCYNVAHMLPRTTNRQQCQKTDVIISPSTINKAKRKDYFGNWSYLFEVQKNHKKLSIKVTSEIDVNRQNVQDNFDFGLTAEEAVKQLQRSTKVDDILAREFALDSPFIQVSDEIKAYALPSFESGRSLLSSVKDLTARIYKDFTYSPESTTISTPLDEVLATRKGVCQDFAHLQIACLRAMGLPAKYVSGYIETLPPPGQEKLVGTDASHAWLSVYSPVEGWVEFDPTNNTLATDQHIITAWGRDFYDVTPLKGIIYGGGEEPRLHVSVDVARVG